MLAISLHKIPVLVQKRLVETHSRQARKVAHGKVPQHRLLTCQSASRRRKSARRTKSQLMGKTKGGQHQDRRYGRHAWQTRLSD